jgi:hypothetical protein
VTQTQPPTQQCSIALWRGYVTAQFYVRSKDHDRALGFSQAFRTWRLPWKERKPMAEDPSVLAALAALEAELLSSGWERMRRAPGSEWYELRFRRGRSATKSSRMQARTRRLVPISTSNAGVADGARAADELA